MHKPLRGWSIALALMTVACPGEPPPPTPPPPPPPAPSLIAIAPPVGTTDGGESVTLSGANLSDVTTVAFGTAAATIASQSAAEIVVTSPLAERGVVTITVTSPAGTGELANAFTYEQAVRITSVTPSTLPANVATTLTIEGSGFFVDATDPVVLIGTNRGTLSAVADNSLSVDLPGLDVGSYDINVSNADGRDAIKIAGLIVRESVQVTGVNPNWSFMTETKLVTIVGSAFDNAVAVQFGAVDAISYQVIDSTTIEATTPPSSVAGAVDVVVRRGLGDEGSYRGGFTYYDAGDTNLRILSVNPATGRNTGGDQVILTGTGFDSLTTIQFAGAEASIDQVTSTSIQIQTPPYSLSGTLVSEPVDVTARRQAQTATAANGFTYFRIPVISQVTPTVLASAGGESVTVNGEGFTIGSTQVFFGTMAATNVNVITQSELSCDSPPHPEGENIPVKVQTEFETSAEWVGVAFREFTRIQTVTPDVISKAGRTFMTVTGTGFALPIHMTVTIDGNPVDDLARDAVDFGTMTFRSRGPMNVGSKTLLVRNNETGQQDTAVIQAVDPTDKNAVRGGGPIAHNINVTVISEDTGLRLPGAVVFAGGDGAVTEASYNKGLTDVDGMVTLSGSKVQTGPIMLTVGKNTYENHTIIDLDAQNITVLLTPNNPQAQTHDFGVISGVVTGWANAGLPSGNPDTRFYRVARVLPSWDNAAAGNYVPGIESYAIEIRANQSACSLQLIDGTPVTLTDAAYSINSLPGTHAVIAVVMYWDSVDGVCGNNPISGTQACIDAGGNNCEGWTGWAYYNDYGFYLTGTTGATYGITTDIDVQGGGGALSGQNINLDVGAALFSTNINGNPTYIGANGTAYTSDLHIKLGNSGSFVFQGDLKGDGMGISFGPVPSLRGAWTYDVRGYVGRPQVNGTTIVGFELPTATSFARSLVNMSPPTLSTWVFFARFAVDAFQNGTTASPTEGRFTFTRSGGVQSPDMTLIYVFDAGSTTETAVWSIEAKGDLRTITLPEISSETRMDNIADGNHFWQLTQIKVDNFDFNNRTARDVGALAWRAATTSEVQVLDKTD